MSNIFWLDDIPAFEQNLPACGFRPTDWYPNGCTKVADHKDDHGHPNWSGRLVARKGVDALTLDIRHSHGDGTAVIKSKTEGYRMLSWLKEQIDEAFPENLM